MLTIEIEAKTENKIFNRKKKVNLNTININRCFVLNLYAFCFCIDGLNNEQKFWWNWRSCCKWEGTSIMLFSTLNIYLVSFFFYGRSVMLTEYFKLCYIGHGRTPKFHRQKHWSLKYGFHSNESKFFYRTSLSQHWQKPIQLNWCDCSKTINYYK